MIDSPPQKFTTDLVDFNVFNFTLPQTLNIIPNFALTTSCRPKMPSRTRGLNVLL